MYIKENVMSLIWLVHISSKVIGYLYVNDFNFSKNDLHVQIIVSLRNSGICQLYAG